MSKLKIYKNVLVKTKELTQVLLPKRHSERWKQRRKLQFSLPTTTTMRKPINLH